MSRFEENLWRSVVDRHGEELARADVLMGTRARRPRPRVLAGATAAVVGLRGSLLVLAGAAAVIAAAAPRLQLR